MEKYIKVWWCLNLKLQEINVVKPDSLFITSYSWENKLKYSVLT